MPSLTNDLIWEASVAKRKDPYRVLGVRETATDAEIKKQYRRLAGEHHPDKNNGKAASVARTTEINIAYDELHDPEKRATLDARLKEERARQEEFKRAFEQYFKRNRSAGSVPRDQAPSQEIAKPPASTHQSRSEALANLAVLGAVGVAFGYVGSHFINRASS